MPDIQFNSVDFASGASSGLVRSGDGLTLAPGRLETLEYTDPFASVPVLGRAVDGSGIYVLGTWTSPVYEIPCTQVVSSWNTKTSPGTWVQSEIQPLVGGRWAKWYVLGRWTYGDSDFHRTSVADQDDGDGLVDVDTFRTKERPAEAYRLRLSLFRRAGLNAEQAPVSASRYSAVASKAGEPASLPSSTSMNAEAIDLQLPSFSQELHRGHYPEFDDGGEAWCSPSSTAMVVRYWENKTGTPYAPTDTSWVDPPTDPEVDYTARRVYDYRYQGAGNWPFNTAYAAERGLVGDVMQLHDLVEAEAFLRAGVPLVASVAWEPGQLDTAIRSTTGHLLVIGGLTEEGNVIAYDPASETNAAVRHTYDREQFERAWIPASGGIVYVIRPAGWQ